MSGNWIWHGVRIARIEWIRHRREFGGRWSGSRPILGSLLLVAAIGFGGVAYSFGRDLASARQPLEGVRILATGAFLVLLWRSSTLTHRRFERLDPDTFLVAVPARAAALGLLLFVYARLVVVLAAPTVGVAVGTALGLRAPSIALTVVAAVAGVVALAVGVGAAGRLAAHLVGRRLVRGGRYRHLLIVFGWIPLVAIWIALEETSLSIAPLFALLEAQPVTWSIDLALLGASEPSGIRADRALGALAGLVLSVPLVAAVTAVLARRVWELEPTGSKRGHGSHSLVDEGLLERVFGGYVSRPVLTVARERWLMERRVPRGLLSTGYVLCFVALLVLPVFSLAGVPLLLLVAFGLGLAAGVAIGFDPIGVEYRVLPMLFTTVGGRRFVGGILLAALVTGTAVVAPVVLPLGLASPAGVPATLLIALVGVASCVCAASVCVAVGMGVERHEYVPVPFFFTDVPVYSELGVRPFLRLGKIFALVSLVCVPAFLGNTAPVYERAPALGAPIGVVRLGSLLLTVLVAVAVSRTASLTAVARYRTYRLR